jgi:hypothetical protein
VFANVQTGAAFVAFTLGLFIVDEQVGKEP